MKDLNKYNQYKGNINKMCGYLSEYFVDKAIEEEDFSFIADALIDYFINMDVGYIVSRYKDLGLDEKFENLDVDVEDWYDIKEEASNGENIPTIPNISERDQNTYIKEMIQKRRNTDDGEDEDK